MNGRRSRGRLCWSAQSQDPARWTQWLAGQAARPRDQHGGETLQGGRNVVSLHEVDGAAVVLKDFGLRHIQPLIYALRSSKAIRAALAADLLIGLDLPTPAALAVYEQRCGGLLQRALLVTRFLPGCHTLRACMEQQRHDPAKILPVLGGLVRRLHDQHCWHADLTAANVLLTDRDPTRQWLIDINRLRRRKLGQEARWRNIGQLSLPDAQWPAFLDGYAPELDSAQRAQACRRLCHWHERFRRRGLRKRLRKQAKRTRGSAETRP